MSEILPKTALSRFLDLRVDEVSLVDTPANEVVFIVAKNNQKQNHERPEGEMAGEAGATAQGAERVEVEVAKAESDAVKAAMGQVTALIEGISKAAGIGEAAAPSLEDVEKAATTKARKAFEDQMKSAGLAGDALAKAMKKFDKKNFGASDDEDDKEKTKKALEAQASAEAASEASIEGTLDAIQKAKAFTPQRVAKLKDTVETLQKLLMEVIGVHQSPATHVPAVTQHANVSSTRAALMGVTKNLEGGDALLAAVEALSASVAKLSGGETVTKSATTQSEELVAVLKGLQTRLEALEKARPAPASEGDGADSSVQKGSKFWGGVL